MLSMRAAIWNAALRPAGVGVELVERSLLQQLPVGSSQSALPAVLPSAPWQQCEAMSFAALPSLPSSTAGQARGVGPVVCHCLLASPHSQGNQGTLACGRLLWGVDGWWSEQL